MLLLTLYIFDIWQAKTMPVIKMQRYTPQQSFQIVKIDYRNSNEKSTWLISPISTSLATSTS